MTLAVDACLGISVVVVLSGIVVGCVEFDRRRREFAPNTHQYCELQYNRSEAILCQPANGGTAFAFLALPIFVAWRWHGADRTAGRRLDVFARRTPEAVLFALSGVWLCLGNLAFHGFCIENGHKIDGSSMVFLLATPLSRGLQKCLVGLPYHRARFWLAWVLMVVLFDPMLVDAVDVEALYYYGLPMLVCVEVCYASAFERRRLADPWAAATAALFVVGFVARHPLDRAALSTNRAPRRRRGTSAKTRFAGTDLGFSCTRCGTCAAPRRRSQCTACCQTTSGHSIR